MCAVPTTPGTGSRVPGTGNKIHMAAKCTNPNSFLYQVVEVSVKWTKQKGSSIKRILAREMVLL